MNDPYSLGRFEVAQNQDDTYERALGELRGGHKRSHWMWFVFPQITGLGRSETARTYAISSLGEARAYLEHPVLGARLSECTSILTEHVGLTAQDIFGATDAMKLRSSMTLFARAASDGALFNRVLNDYFGGIADPATEERLEAS